MTFLTTIQNVGLNLNPGIFLTEAETGKEAAFHLLETIRPGMSMDYTLVEDPAGNKITAVPNDQFVSDHRTLTKYEQSDETLIIHIRTAQECEETLLDAKLEEDGCHLEKLTEENAVLLRKSDRIRLLYEGEGEGATIVATGYTEGHKVIMRVQSTRKNYEALMGSGHLDGRKDTHGWYRTGY